MNKLRKIIALMLSLSVIFTAAISVFSAENFDDDGNRDNDAGLSDEEQNVLIQDSHPKHELDNPDDVYIEDIEYDTYIMGKNEYDETVKKLTAFEMWVPIDDGSYLQPIKAGEFFLSVCRYINCDSFYDEDANKEDMWEKAHDMLKSMGYVDFNIDCTDEISFDNALRTLVNALGYKQIAYMYGGNDNAYIQIAANYDITKNFLDNRSASIRRTDAASLLNDSIKADVYISYGNNGHKSINTLEYFKDAYKITGVVESVSEHAITSGDTIYKGIRIGDYLLASDRSDLYDYLACKVEAYYRKEDSGGNTLLYISYHKNNSIITIDGEDIKSVENNMIRYYSDNKTKKVSLNSSAKEILNGFSPKLLDEEDFYNCDYIRLVDNDNNGKYDVVFVYKYDIMVVKRIVESQGMIYGLYNDDPNGSLKVNFADCDMTDRMGNPVDAYYITEDSILSVAKDIETNKTKIIVSNLMYTGVVKSTNGTKIKFEDRTYKYSTNAEYYKDAKAIKNGNKYTVYLDYRGRIAGYDLLKTDDIQYGFLIQAWIEDNRSDVIAKLLPYTGDMNEFKLARSTKIDGLTCKDAEKIITALKIAADYQRSTLATLDSSYKIMADYSDDSYVYVRVPIMYKLNDEGEIKYIDTPYHSDNENPEWNDVFHDNSMTMYNDFSKRTSSIKPGGMYLRNTLAFNSDNGNNVAINSKTKVFVVPVSNDRGDIGDASQYIKTNLTYFDDWVYYPQTGTQYTTENRIEAYNVDESRTAGVIVYYTSDVIPEIDKKVPLTVVDEVVKAVNDNDESVTRIIGWQGNAQMQVDLAEDVYLKRYYNGPNGSKIMSEVKHGDIIRYVTNSKGELVDYVKVFSLKDEDNPDYVKTGNEEGKTAETSTLNKTMIAVSDGKYAENGHNTSHIYNAIGSYNYGAMYRLVYGTLLYRNGTNLVLKTKVDTALGQTDKIEIADFSGYNVLFIDETTNRIYVPTEDDLLAEQSAGEAASKVILHTEGGKQRQLIIIKRAG